MKHSDRLAELVVRLSISPEFVEFWQMVAEHRDQVVADAIHGTAGDPAEKRGAARELDLLIKTVAAAPGKTKKLQSVRQ